MLPLLGSVPSEQEEWGECAVRAPVQPRQASRDPLGQDLVGQDPLSKLTSYREPLVSSGVPVRWHPPDALVFGSGASLDDDDDETKPNRAVSAAAERTEPVYLEFQLRLGAK